eukprot:gnl/Chilomastix_cuspidata/724.p1 GENE.gnl/Chilomastix_cuspidata/724~~gnl/Chilomastix_cuspidata/724.p1  ORF type:complete len:470 (+),score=216.08 gnl/Chilomastix_cuspidata/724:239-1648(+)
MSYPQRTNCTVMSTDELDRIRKLAERTAPDSHDHTKPQTETQRRLEASVARAKKWSNTIEGARAQRLKAQEKRKREQDEYYEKIHQEELELKRAERQKILDNAKKCHLEEAQPVRALNAALRLSAVVSGREAQLQDVARRREREVREEKEFVVHVKRMSALEETARREESVAAAQKTREVKRFNLEQIRLNEELRRLESAEVLEERERLKAQCEQAERAEREAQLRRAQKKQEANEENARFNAMSNRLRADQRDAELRKEAELRFEAERSDRIKAFIEAQRATERTRQQRRTEAIRPHLVQALQAMEKDPWVSAPVDEFYRRQDKVRREWDERWEAETAVTAEINEHLVAKHRADARVAEFERREADRHIFEDQEAFFKEEEAKKRAAAERARVYKATQELQLAENAVRRERARREQVEDERRAVREMFDAPKDYALRELQRHVAEGEVPAGPLVVTGQALLNDSITRR